MFKCREEWIYGAMAVWVSIVSDYNVFNTQWLYFHDKTTNLQSTNAIRLVQLFFPVRVCTRFVLIFVCYLIFFLSHNKCIYSQKPILYRIICLLIRCYVFHIHFIHAKMWFKSFHPRIIIKMCLVIVYLNTFDFKYLFLLSVLVDHLKYRSIQLCIITKCQIFYHFLFVCLFFFHI